MSKAPSQSKHRKLSVKSLIWTWMMALALASMTAAQTPGHTGIPEIDSLPLHDWHLSTERLSYSKALTLSLLPGGGQIYGHHPVRGGFLIGMETLLGGLALYSRYVDIPHWKDQAQTALDSADALFEAESQDPSSFGRLEPLRRQKVEFARDRIDLASKQADLVNSEFAWAVGLHVYGMLDAVEIAYLSRHNDLRTRSVHKALWRGLLFPGGGQLYNHRYGKFGMLWMALGASAVSIYSRQEMVDELNVQIQTARVEAGSETDTRVQTLEKDRTLYRKRRNQYFWGMSLFYVYAVLDGMVDAALSDFDAPQRFAVTAGPDGSVGLLASLPF
jgi:hypothetical protein